jgi:hypothetical protein
MHRALSKLLWSYCVSRYELTPDRTMKENSKRATSKQHVFFLVIKGSTVLLIKVKRYVLSVTCLWCCYIMVEDIDHADHAPQAWFCCPHENKTRKDCHNNVRAHQKVGGNLILRNITTRTPKKILEFYWTIRSWTLLKSGGVCMLWIAKKKLVPIRT